MLLVSHTQVFVSESQPVIDALKETGRVAEIDASTDVDTVFETVVTHMEALQELGKHGCNTLHAPTDQISSRLACAGSLLCHTRPA